MAYNGKEYSGLKHPLLKEYNKDFYPKIPKFCRKLLDNFIRYYGRRPWFPEAWSKYREEVLTNKIDDVHLPQYSVFRDYIMEDKKKGII